MSVAELPPAQHRTAAETGISPLRPWWLTTEAKQLALMATQDFADDSVATGTVVRLAAGVGQKLGIGNARMLVLAARAGVIEGHEPPPPQDPLDRPAVQWRTLADIDDAPPGELLLGMLEPEGPNLLYGDGGVGKGTTCVWIIAECVKMGIVPMIYDAENHPREWRRRAGGLGVGPAEVVYRQPHELPPHLVGRPLHIVVPHLGDVAQSAGCGILIIDSIIAASNLSEEGLKGDARAPYQYVSALNEIGITSVSIGHTPKNSPEGDPYGSVSWINAMRLTWLGTDAGGEGHRVRWLPKKRNERGHIAAILLGFQYDEAGKLCGVTREDDERATRLWLIDRLASGPQTVEELAEEMAEVGDAAGVARAKDRLRQTLGRMKRAHQVHKTGGRGAPWALGGPSRNGKRDREE